MSADGGATGVEAVLAEAEALAAARRFPEAADRYAAAVVLDPTRPEGYVGAARAQADSGRVDDRTVALLTQAATVDPGFLATYGVAARIGLHLPELRFAALRLLETGALARPDAVAVWVWLARLQAATARIADVRRSLRQLEVLTGTPRHALLPELAADPDLAPPAVAVLRRAAGLTV